MDESAKAAKATLWYTISNIILRGVSIFTAPIFTRLLSTADYGIASNFNTWCNIVACVTELSLSTAVIRGKIDFKKNYKQYLSSVQTLGLLWCLLICFLMSLSLDFWSNFMQLDKICIVIMFAYLIAYPSLGYAQIDMRFDYKYKENVAISIINTSGVVFSSIGLILLWSDQRYLGRIVGAVLPSIVMGIWFARKIFHQGRHFIDLNYWKYALNISLPMIPHGLAMIILGQIDRVMIIRFCGESAAGIYSFAYSYAVLLFVVTNAINDAVQPEMYHWIDEGNEQKMADFSYKLMLLGGMFSLIIIGVGPEALKILGTRDYYEGRWIIMPVVLGTMMQYMYQFFGLLEVYSKKTIFMAIGSCLAAVVNYMLNYFFIPKFGWIAAAYTTFVSYFLLMILHFYMARIAYRKKVFRFIPICGITLVFTGTGMILNILYDGNVLIRYTFLFVIIAIISYYLKDEIAMIVKKVLIKTKP